MVCTFYSQRSVATICKINYLQTVKGKGMRINPVLSPDAILGSLRIPDRQPDSSNTHQTLHNIFLIMHKKVKI